MTRITRVGAAIASIAITVAVGAGAAPAASTPKHLQYYGGPLIPHVQITPVVYGTWSYGANSSTPNITKDNLTNFFNTVFNSSYVDKLSEYNAGSQTIGRGSADAWRTITPSAGNNTASVTETQVAAALSNKIVAGTLPPPNVNRVYVVFLRSGQLLTTLFSSSNQDFCALQNTMRVNGVWAYYVLVPYEATNYRCKVGNALQSLTVTLSRQIAAAMTNPLANPPGAGWLDPNHGDIGDLCAQMPGSVGGYQVQQLWSNATNGCRT